MKKAIVFTFLFITGLANAQESAITKEDIKFGIKAGVNFSDVKGDVARSNLILGDLPLARYHIGGFVEIKLSNKFSIQSEILYSRKGFASEIESTSYSTIQARNQLNYIDIPIMIKYYFTKKGSVELGPQVGFLVSSTQRLNYLKRADLNGVNTVDFGLNLGLSVDLGKYIFLGVRSNIGLLDILKEKDKQVYNRVFQISVGHKFK